MFGDLTSKFGSKASSPDGSHIYTSDQIVANGRGVSFGDVSISYDDIIEAIFNQDNVLENGVGGSLILKTLAHDNAYAQNYVVRRFRFSEEAIRKAESLFNDIERKTCATDRLNINDEIFASGYYAQAS